MMQMHETSLQQVRLVQSSPLTFHLYHKQRKWILDSDRGTNTLGKLRAAQNTSSHTDHAHTQNFVFINGMLATDPNG